jgi:hypothetical protein
MIRSSLTVSKGCPQDERREVEQKEFYWGACAADAELPPGK